jgi:hypothetical protein
VPLQETTAKEASAPGVAVEQKKPDLKQLSDEELVQLMLDIGGEIDIRRGRPGEAEKAIHHRGKFAGESDKILRAQQTVVDQENKGLRATREKFKQDLKAFYEDGGALRAFDQLVSDGCDEEFLFYTISAIRTAYKAYEKQPTSDSPFESLAGFTRKKLKTVIGQMRNSADNIRHLRVDFLARLVPQAYQSLARYTELQTRLPSELKELADVTEKAARHLRLRGRPEYDDDIATLVRHVEERTGEPRDSKVSALIAFATKNEEFTAEDLRTWRMEHPDLLQSPR